MVEGARHVPVSSDDVVINAFGGETVKRGVMRVGEGDSWVDHNPCRVGRGEGEGPFGSAEGVALGFGPEEGTSSAGSWWNGVVGRVFRKLDAADNFRGYVAAFSALTRQLFLASEGCMAGVRIHHLACLPHFC